MPRAKSPAFSTSQWFRWMVLTLVCISLGTLIIMAQEVSQELQNLREELHENIQWNLTQIEVDLLQFENEARLAGLDPAADLAQLRLRYDLFYSRARIAMGSRCLSDAAIDSGASELVGMLRDYLDKTTPLIDAGDDRLRPDLTKIAADARTYRQTLRRTITRLIQDHAAATVASREPLTLLMQKLGWTTAFVLISLITLLYATLLYATLILRQQSEASKRENERLTSRLQATVGTALDAVIVATRDGRILDFNPAAERIFGYSRSEALDRPPEDLILSEQTVGEYRRTKEKIADGVADGSRFTVTTRRKSGEEFPAEMSIAWDVSADGRIFISYLRDVSDQVAAEQGLRQARDDAVAAEQAKTNFIAVVSHEMRTPLNGLLATLDFATEEAANASQKRFLDLARASADQLLRHVDDVLELSKAETGQLAIVQETFDLRALLDSVVEPAKAKADQMATSLTLEAPDKLPTMIGDPFRIGQILNNLVTNALKFASGGAVAVAARLEPLRRKQVRLAIDVTDTGIGISPEDQGRIFDPFVMPDASYGRSAGGTGLGLAISRGLAERMGGSLVVESTPGIGSRFTLSLPLATGRRTQDGSANATSAAPVAGHKLDVLIVEDNLTNRIVLEEMVTRLGHDVALAENGLIGVRMAAARRFDVILMDVSMPEMDGPTATGEIRRAGASRKSRVIAVTAHSMPEEIERFRKAGMLDILTKPIARAALERPIGRAATGEAEAQAAPAEQAARPTFDPERIDEISAALGLDRTISALERFCADMRRIGARLAADEALTAEDHAALFHEAKGCAAVIGHRPLTLVA
ncbi:hybrid sensor histidine kinase/response regulator [Aliigemmobacter aestuarii]|nr:ATP-binding protein [Gemmobacter aestuarii]